MFQMFQIQRLTVHFSLTKMTCHGMNWRSSKTSIVLQSEASGLVHHNPHLGNTPHETNWQEQKCLSHQRNACSQMTWRGPSSNQLIPHTVISFRPKIVHLRPWLASPPSRCYFCEIVETMGSNLSPLYLLLPFAFRWLIGTSVISIKNWSRYSW